MQAPWADSTRCCTCAPAVRLVSLCRVAALTVDIISIYTEHAPPPPPNGDSPLLHSHQKSPAPPCPLAPLSHAAPGPPSPPPTAFSSVEHVIQDAASLLSAMSHGPCAAIVTLFTTLLPGSAPSLFLLAFSWLLPCCVAVKRCNDAPSSSKYPYTASWTTTGGGGCQNVTINAACTATCSADGVGAGYSATCIGTNAWNVTGTGCTGVQAAHRAC